MSSLERNPAEFGDGSGDQPVDVQRFAAVLRRSAGLIATVTVVVTVAVVLISSALPKSYQASATIVFNPATSLLQPTDSTSIQRELATFQAFVRSPPVVAAAARSLSEPATAVKNATQSSADPNANIITITATGPRPVLAARRANAVARAFVTSQAKLQSAGFQAAVAQLRAQIDRLNGTPDSGAQISALRDRIGALQISAASIPTQLQVGDPATVPTSAASPKPAVNGIVALAASLLIVTLFVLARDQFRPRFASPRALGRALGSPVLASVPYRGLLGGRRRRRGIAAAEQRAYDALRAALTVNDGSGATSRVFLITSATNGEGKSSVTVGLGRSLERMGQRVLVVSGDLRSPTLHQHLGLRRAPGLAECLSVASRDDAQQVRAKLDKWIRPVPGALSLDSLDAGGGHPDPASLLSRRALEVTLAAIRRLRYDYVLIDSAPILGVGDTQFFARAVDVVLLVARLDVISADNVEDLHDLFARLRLRPLGVVVVGAKPEGPPDDYGRDWARAEASPDGYANAAIEDPRPASAQAPAPRSSPSRERKPRAADGGQSPAPRTSPSRQRRRRNANRSQSQASRSSPTREPEQPSADGDQSPAPRGSPAREPERRAPGEGQSQTPPGPARV